MDSDRCRGCDERRETLDHVLLECQAFKGERERYWTDEALPLTMRGVLSDTANAVRAAKQLLTTALLHQFTLSHESDVIRREHKFM